MALIPPRIPSAEAPAPAEALVQQMPPRIDSGSLFGSAREIVIEHNARDYRLRVTAQGKLILTA